VPLFLRQADKFLDFPDNSASKSICGEPMSAAAAAEWVSCSGHYAVVPSFFREQIRLGFPNFDFDIRIQHFRFITESR